MTSKFRTVSEEMAWTDWSGAARATGTDQPSRRSRVLVAILVGAAMIAGIVYMLPAGSY